MAIKLAKKGSKISTGKSCDMENNGRLEVSVVGKGPARLSAFCFRGSTLQWLHEERLPPTRLKRLPSATKNRIHNSGKMIRLRVRSQGEKLKFPPYSRAAHAREIQ